jgi:hypothetical protein
MVRVAQNNKVVEIVDKPRRTDLTHMWGCIMWRNRFTEHLHACVSNGMSDFAAILNDAIAAGMKVRGVLIAGGTYQDLAPMTRS